MLTVKGDDYVSWSPLAMRPELSKDSRSTLSGPSDASPGVSAGEMASNLIHVSF